MEETDEASFIELTRSCSNNYSQLRLSLPPIPDLPYMPAHSGSTGNLNLYPNPATDQVTLKLTKVNTGDVVRLEVFDLPGKTLISRMYQDVQQTLIFDVSALKSGLYTIRVTASGKTETGKLIVK